MQSLRKILYPFSVLYDMVTYARNKAFDIGLLQQRFYDVPVIAVGNLSTGGTGKTPMIEYLIKHFSGQNIAVISRGYGRKTKGFRIITDTCTSSEVGDEPLQMFLKFAPDVMFAVGENRVNAIDRVLEIAPQTDVILLDDAYQHRYVKASKYILLTSYYKPFYKDVLLPAGNLRESSRGVQRADVVVVTKCPQDLTVEQKRVVLKKLGLKTEQKAFFSTIAYSEVLLNSVSEIRLEDITQEVTLLTGIAHPSYFVKHVSRFVNVVEHLQFSDHHHFSQKDIEKIATRKIVITTEKDFVRLRNSGLINLYYLPIKTQFLFEDFSL